MTYAVGARHFPRAREKGRASLPPRGRGEARGANAAVPFDRHRTLTPGAVDHALLWVARLAAPAHSTPRQPRCLCSRSCLRRRSALVGVRVACPIGLRSWWGPTWVGLAMRILMVYSHQMGHQQAICVCGNLRDERATTCRACSLPTLAGRRFGKLTVAEAAGSRVRPVGKHERLWLCHCDCGKSVLLATRSLTRRARPTRSCGCLRRSSAAERQRLAEPWHVSRNRALQQYRKGAKRKGHSFRLTDDEAFALFAQACHYCGAPPHNSINAYLNLKGQPRHAKHRGRPHLADAEFLYSGIDRVNNRRGYLPGNCVPCCSTCNTMKRDLPAAIFLSWLDRVVAYRSVQPR